MPEIPTPPLTCNAPSPVPLDAVFTSAFPIIVSPAIFARPPTLIFPPIPTPPATTNAPLLVFVDIASLLTFARPFVPIVKLPVKLETPATDKLSPILVLPEIPAPPVTRNALVPVDTPPPPTEILPPKNKLPLIDAPPFGICNAPVFISFAGKLPSIYNLPFEICNA